MLSITTVGLVAGIISIISGIVILKWQRSLTYIVAAYLIIMGVVAILYVVL